MSYNRPGFKEINQRVKENLETVDLPYSFRGLLANSVSGLSYMLHGHIDYLAANMLPDTAKGSLLDRWAEIVKEPRKKAQRTKATFEIQSTSEKKGYPVPKLWLIDGHEFAVRQEIICNGETQTVEIISKEEGDLKIAEEAQPLCAITTPWLTISKIGKGKIFQGDNRESEEALRSRVLFAIANPPQGGAPADYIRWAKAIPSIKQAWVRPSYLMGEPGKVGVTFLNGEGCQTPDLISELEDALKILAPDHAEVHILPLKPKEVKISFTVDPAELKPLVEAEVKRLCTEVAPKNFLDADGQKTSGKLALSSLWAIGERLGAKSFVVKSPTADIETADLEVLCYVP